MTMVPPLAEALRGATRAAHEALERQPLLAPLLQPTVTLAEYARALAALYAPQAALEARVARWAPAEDFPPRLSDLAADLAALGVAPLPLAGVPPCARTAAEGVGILYVLEGSNLGSAVLARHLAAHLPAGTPLAFFGGADEKRWQRFWSFAAKHCPPADYPQSAAAARAAFACYRDHLDRWA